ncbi:hypothetical protein BpHYR1_028298 [Brachionus plicatilis]|uniref:Uncharacterized protein n=1 Tax=Brachionus plicatilis TaxID=10195 RepID=A0A3M7P445_BRAPC|nr:hypothetical protein BpHYR1_028298 [Brachionus plicatilis]
MPPKKKKQQHETVSETQIKKDDDIEMIAVKYHVIEPNHPFSEINGVTGSVAIQKILDDIEREDLLKGTMVNFIHEMDEHVLMIQGEIMHEKIFRINLRDLFGVLDTIKFSDFENLNFKGIKYLKDSAKEMKTVGIDMSMNAISTQLATLNSNLLKSNEENRELRSLLLEQLSPNSSRCTSPSFPRKSTKDDSIMKEDECDLSNSKF